MGPGNRPLDFDWLEDFVALAESGNFSRAAQARSIAQPAFSRHIKQLEEWVGVDLFDRSTHPVSLTEAGRRMLPGVEDVLQRLENTRHKARQAHERAAVSLHFAATHVLSLTFFPKWLSGIESRLELGPIQMVSDSYTACEELMLQKRVQFLLCHGHPAVATRLDDAQFQFVTVSDDLLIPVSAAASANAEQMRIHSGQMLPVLSYSQESGLGRIVRERLGSALDESPFRTVFTAHHAVLLKTMALEGRGIAWLPRSLIRDELAAGALVEAGDESWQIPVGIRLFCARGNLPPAAEALWKAAVPTQ